MVGVPEQLGGGARVEVERGLELLHRHRSIDAGIEAAVLVQVAERQVRLVAHAVVDLAAEERAVRPADRGRHVGVAHVEALLAFGRDHAEVVVHLGARQHLAHREAQDAEDAGDARHGEPGGEQAE